MPKVSLAFFMVAPVYGLIGMVWGVIMGATNDHAMSPAHAHLNLLGLVLMSIMGTFYALAGARASARLAWINFWLSNAAIVIMIPTLTQVLTATPDQMPTLIPIISIGELLAVLGLGTFLASVVSVWRAKDA